MMMILIIIRIDIIILIISCYKYSSYVLLVLDKSATPRVNKQGNYATCLKSNLNKGWGKGSYLNSAYVRHDVHLFIQNSKIWTSTLDPVSCSYGGFNATLVLIITEEVMLLIIIVGRPTDTEAHRLKGVLIYL